MADRKTYEELNKFKRKHNIETLWSWSRFDTYCTSPYEYYLRYIIHQKEDRTDCIYGTMGGLSHDILEKLYLNEIKYEEMDGLFEDSWMMANLSNLKFDRTDTEKNKNIGDKYYHNLKHFFSNHKPLPYKILTEQFITVKIGNHYFQGYIDACFKDEDGNYTILDYKTSSKYSNKVAKDKCGQLVVYAIGLHQRGIPLDKIKICWNFLKYVNVVYEQANGKKKTRVIERRSLGKNLQANVKMWLKKCGYEDEAFEYIDKMVQENSITVLPQEVQDKFVIEDCIVYVDLTDDLIDRWVTEIQNTIDEIEEKTCKYENTKLYDPVNADKIFYDTEEQVHEQSYYFAVLSGYSPELHKPYKNYLDKLEREKNVALVSYGKPKQNESEQEDDLSWLNNL